MMNNPKRLHRWLRERHGRVIGLAHLLDTSRQSIQNWRMGKKTPAPGTRDAIELFTDGKVPADGWPVNQDP